jgi:phosphohistidine swiveling domain-containing protein
MGINGLLIDVRWEWTGTEVTADLLIGATVLPVLDPEAITVGENVWIAETGPYEILERDEDAATFTVTPGLIVDIDSGTEVATDIGGQPGRAWVAEVVLPDAERPIEVPLTIHDLAVMPEGTYDPPVGIVLSNDMEKVENLPGSLPSIPGEYIPPDSLPASGNTIYRQTEEPWANGTPDKPDNALWYDTDDNNKPWLWDADTMVWVDASDPRTDILDDPDQIIINEGNSTIEDLIDAVTNINETATSARSLASSADGRVSFSDYDPTPEDISYWQVNADGTLAKGAPFEIRQASLTSGIATLTLGDAAMITPAGGYVIIEAVGEPFDGEWVVLDSATTEMVVTDAALTSSVATITMASPVPWVVGQEVTLSNLDDVLNGPQTIESITGDEFTFSVPGEPPDIPSGIMVGSATVYTVRYRIPNEANIGIFAVPDAASGYNVPLLQRVEGSIWYTRTRARLSHITNPSFELNLDGWAAVNATMDRVDPVVPDDPSNPDMPIGGDWVAEITNDATTGDHRAEWTGGTPGKTVQQGETYSATCFATLMSGSGEGAFASVRFYDNTATLIDEIEGPAISLLVDDWMQLEVTADVPTGAVTAAPMILHNPNASAVWRIDGGLVEQAEYAGRYFDGDFYDSCWGETCEGTPHNDISVMEGGKIISVYELYDGAWVRLDFTGSTQYDANAADLTQGYLDPARLEDNSVPPWKIMGTPMRVSDPVVDGDFVNVWDNGGLFFMRPAIASVDGMEAHGFVRESGAAGDVVTLYTDGYNDLVVGMVPGSVFLSSTVAGRATRAVPQNSGEVVQMIGTAVNESTVHFNPTARVLLY